MSEPDSPGERTPQLPHRPPSPTGTAPPHQVTAAGPDPAAHPATRTARHADPDLAVSIQHDPPAAAPAAVPVTPVSWHTPADAEPPAEDPAAPPAERQADASSAEPKPTERSTERVPAWFAVPDEPDGARQRVQASAVEQAVQSESAHQPVLADSSSDHSAQSQAARQPAEASAAEQAVPSERAYQAAQMCAAPEQSSQSPQQNVQSAAADHAAQSQASPNQPEPSMMAHRTEQLARPSAAAQTDQAARGSQPEPTAAPTQYGSTGPEPMASYSSQPDQAATQYQPPQHQPGRYLPPPGTPEPPPTQVQPPAYGHTGPQPPAPVYSHPGPQPPVYGHTGPQSLVPGHPGQQQPVPPYGHTGPHGQVPGYGHTGQQAQVPGYAQAPQAMHQPPRQATLRNQEPVGLDQLLGGQGDERTERARPPRGPRPPRDPRPPRAAGPPKNNKGLIFALQVLGLILVALLAGTMWVACSPTGHSQKPTSTPTASAPASAPATAGRYTFQQVSQQADAECQPNSYGKAAEFFAQHPCQALTRWLYTTTSQSGEKVVTAMAKVQMPDAGSAADLDALVKQDGTGSVGYLTHPGFVVPAGPTRMGKTAGFAATANDTVVLIAESAFLETNTSDEPQLKQISSAALTSQGR